MSPTGERIDEERLATLTARCSEPEARRELVGLCRPLAERLARRFLGRGEAYEDLVQVAMIGLIKAVDNFDCARGESLLPYATAVIGGELKHHFRDAASTIRMPRAVRQRSRVVYDAVEELTQRLGRSPTIAEISAETDLAEEQVLDVHMAGYMSGPSSIDEITESQGGASLADVRDQDQQAFLEDWMTVSPEIVRLPQQQQRILYLRFYREWSQSMVAADLGISQVHVSRLLARALSQLRTTVS